MTNTPTMTSKQLTDRLVAARLCPSVCHLPGFGLMAPRGWDSHNPQLEARAKAILTGKGIEFSDIEETAPALFWYHSPEGELHLHDWE